MRSTYHPSNLINLLRLQSVNGHSRWYVHEHRDFINADNFPVLVDRTGPN
jgi:hypothetical protein